jgi:hypothetical protein
MQNNSLIILVYLCQNVYSQNSEHLLKNISIDLKQINQIKNNNSHFCFNEIFTVSKSEQCAKLIELGKIYAYTFLSITGILVNLLSFVVIMRAGKKAPRILSKNILIALTISNSIYLILFWYIFILPKIIKYQQYNASNKRRLNFERGLHFSLQNNSSTILLPKMTADILNIETFYLINSNILICKIMNYFYKVFLFINSSMTVIFSLERALAINFPIRMRSTKERRRSLLKIIFMLVIAYCFVYPAYYLFLLNIFNMHNGQQCRIQNESLYFKLTILFVLQTLAIPFILITISNISILVGIERHRRILIKRSLTFRDPSLQFNSFSSASLPSNSLHRPDSRKSSDKKMRLTKILITISASFVLLRLPFFIAWCRFILFKFYITKPFNEEQRNELKRRNEMVDYTEILQLINYAVTGLLYFATGNSFRQNVLASLRCCSNCLLKFFRCKSR